jgi:hypothetical protein
MNNSDNSNNSQVVRQRIREDGKVIYSSRKSAKTGNGDCSPKTPYNERKPKSPKGSAGLSPQQKEHIDLAFHKLASEYGFQNCKYLVLTFDATASDEALNNLIKNFNDLNKAVKYRFEKVAYKNLEVKPYVLVWGLRERTSFDRNIPCFDLNILCVVQDKDGQPIFDEAEIIYQIYLAVSRYAKETIKPPLDDYSRIPNDNYEKLANYFKQQVSDNVLKHFKDSVYADKLPKTYSYVPTSLTKTFVPIITEFEDSTISEHKQLLSEKFSERVTLETDKKDDYKFVAKLNSTESKESFKKEYEETYYRETICKLRDSLIEQSISKSQNTIT